MPQSNATPTDQTPDRLLAAERDVQERLGSRPLDFDANRAISNIYRAAAALRRRAEQGVLAEYRLTWGGFTILWVLWVWGEMPASQLATESDLAKGTLTGMLTTLEKRTLVERNQSTEDKRQVLVSPTPEGSRIIEELFPRFNEFQVEGVDGLSIDEQKELSRLLRVVINNAAKTDDVDQTNDLP